LERVVNPSLPDRPSQPRRLISILVVLATSLLLYGIGWLVLAGVREHRQD
jgi:capsular polysaccharide transport system permease protein